jgi:hypothetical protein
MVADRKMIELNDEVLSAFLDGQLDEPRRLAVEQALAADPGARVRLERMRHADALLRAAIPELPASANDPLVASIERTGPRSARRTIFFGAAAAACLLAATCGVLLGRSLLRAPDAWVDASGLVGGALLQVLEQRASGQRAATLEVMLSTQLRDGRFCRQFAVAARPGGEGVACRNPSTGRWQLLGWDAAVVSSDGFRPAGGSELLDGMLDRLGAGEALTVERERVLIERGWRELPR